MRAFASQKGPGKGLPASGFAPERRESPEFPTLASPGDKRDARLDTIDEDEEKSGHK